MTIMVVSAEQYYGKTPAQAIRRPDLSESLDLSVLIILSYSHLNCCSTVFYQAQMNLILSASSCIER